MTFYNTNKESGETLKSSRLKCNRQEDVILKIFKDNKEHLLCADEIHELSQLNAPITSIRRAITNLYNQGKLIKTNTMKKGRYGKNTHTYQYKSVNIDLVLF